MAATMAQDDDKRLAALAAVAEVRDGMVVGLGTGSTAAHAIRAMGERVRDERLRIEGVATSIASEVLARQWSIPYRDLMHDARVDLAIDGADEIDPGLRAIKGAGGAMLREKIVATAASRMIVIADGSKHVERLGGAKVPVEFLASAQALVERELRALGAAPTLRRICKGAPYDTDQGNRVLDCAFAAIDDPVALDISLSAIPGVFGHGLFVREVDAAYVARNGLVTRLEREGAATILTQTRSANQE